MNVLMENNGALYTTMVAFDKMFNVLVSKMEIGLFLNIIDISPKVNAPIGLGIMITDTNDWGKCT